MLGERGLWALVDARANATPDALLAVDEHDRVLTFEALRARAERVAAALAARGVTDTATVAWQLPTSIEAIDTRSSRFIGFHSLASTGSVGAFVIESIFPL